MTLYRLARKKYANLSGVGAAVSPGRWNVEGQEALYTSVEISTPVLERLAHTPKDTIPKNIAMMHITLSGKWEPRGPALVDVTDDAAIVIFTTLTEATKALPFEAIPPTIFAVAVPSVIVPAWNVVLFPDRKSFWSHVSLKTLEPYEFDRRLFE